MNQVSQIKDKHYQRELSERKDEAIAEALAKSESVYDNCDHEIWQHAVYDRIHHGREFQNISGIRGLDYFAESISDPNARILDLGCGSGEACIYLSQAHGYRLLGIDVNRKQIRRATRKSAALKNTALEIPKYSSSDLGSHDFHDDFGGAFCLESLSLIANTKMELLNISRALKANSPFFVADIFAGANLDAAARRFALYEDGLVSLTSQETFSGLLRDAGFCQITWTDQTDLAVEVCTSILNGVHEYADSTGRQEDPLVQEWLVSSRFYVDAFKERQLECAWCLARKC